MHDVGEGLRLKKIYLLTLLHGIIFFPPVVMNLEAVIRGRDMQSQLGYNIYSSLSVGVLVHISYNFVVFSLCLWASPYAQWPLILGFLSCVAKFTYELLPLPSSCLLCASFTFLLPVLLISLFPCVLSTYYIGGLDIGSMKVFFSGKDDFMFVVYASHVLPT